MPTKNHPLRTDLHDEIHTRPRPPVKAPHSVSHISLVQPALVIGGEEKRNLYKTKKNIFKII
jgi:hypothetical protein